MLAASPASAQLADSELSDPLALKDPGLVCGNMAKVVTRQGQPTDCLAPVAVTRIDGVREIVAAHGFLIEPGVHTLNGRVTLDTTKCHPAESDQLIGSTDDLEVNFEAGKVYYIAYDRNPLNTDERRLVVWKVEPDYPPVIYGQ